MIFEYVNGMAVAQVGDETRDEVKSKSSSYHRLAHSVSKPFVSGISSAHQEPGHQLGLNLQKVGYAVSQGALVSGTKTKVVGGG